MQQAFFLDFGFAAFLYWRARFLSTSFLVSVAVVGDSGLESGSSVEAKGLHWPSRLATLVSALEVLPPERRSGWLRLL